jgi:HAD superfamily hydrolase (TIGR01662 family)
MSSWSVVIPTVGRETLSDLLADLAAQPHRPAAVLVVDDRAVADPPLDLPLDLAETLPVRVRRSGGRGPAAARNVGWRTTGTDWVVFLDDDVLLPDGWSDDLLNDLRSAAAGVGGVQGGIVVPGSAGRRRTDWERSTAGLARALWATADMAYRRKALHRAGGFDERFPRAYREDADLALRTRRAGWRLSGGTRYVVHPVRPEGFWVSARVQRGNADDALMRTLHGPRWRELAGCPRGRFRTHVATVVAGGLGLAALLSHGRVARKAGAAAGLVWLGLTADLFWRRFGPGPRTRDELARTAVTSGVIPPLAVWHRVRGQLRHRNAEPWPGPVRAVLFDRDGTLVHDVPYNGDPDRVVPVTGATEAVRRLRAAGVAVGVVTNQSGIARGRVDAGQVDAVNRRIDELMGPFQTWQVCPHAPDAGCACRKPAPALVLAAADELGVRVHQVAVVGDIAADVAAAEAAGARGVLVPNGRTRPAEVVAVPVVVPDLAAAVDYVLSGESR